MLVQGVGLILSSKESWGHAQTHLWPSRSLLTRTTFKLICPRNTLHSSSFCCTTLHKRISKARDCRKAVSEPKTEYGCTESKSRISQKEKMCPTTVCGCFGVSGEDPSLLLHPWMRASNGGKRALVLTFWSSESWALLLHCVTASKGEMDSTTSWERHG